MRARAASLAVFVSSLLLALQAYGGTYLDSAAVLLDESKRSGEFVQYHLTDVQLAALAHKLAEARVKAGREIPVPRDVEKAHPHLLLALEAAERAMAAAQDGETKKFYHLIVEARQEEQTFRAVLSQLRLTLPELQRCEKK